jgi:hypothetical protein
MPHVRVQNVTGANLDSVVLYAPGPPRTPVDLGALPDGDYSDYRHLAVAYRFAEIDARGADGHLTVRPYDFVGEVPLPEGHYTYRLGREGTRATLTLEAEPADG